ncbi:MAG TPA: ion transporter, partial [Planctomycetaceae bacterium]|nr:ion transporter [Planctomycetaceae bacterium]
HAIRDDRGDVTALRRNAMERSDFEEPDADARGVGPYHLFVFLLGIYALIALAAQTFLPLSGSTLEILDHVDNGICLIFFGDFLINLACAPSKWRYLKWGWIDLVSSIPMVDSLRAGRAARVIRILRAFRSIRSARHVAQHLIQSRGDGAFFGLALLSILLVLFSSIAVLQFETAPESNIHTAQDAVWWAFTTITTVGYGDKFPVTLEGRMIAGTLMMAGVGMFGTFTGLIASWIIAPTKKDQEQDSELSELRNEIVQIRERLERMCDDAAPARDDGELAMLVAAWPELPESVRTRIVASIAQERREAA